MASMLRVAVGDAPLDALEELLDQTIALCNVEAEYTQATSDPVPMTSSNVTVPTVQHGRRIYFRNDQRVDADGLMRLNQLYREEVKVKNDMQRFVESKVCDPDTPRPAVSRPRNTRLEQIMQGPKFSTADYELLGKGFNEQLTHDVDRFARSANLMRNSPNLPGEHLPHYVEQMLDAFFEKFGPPNIAESVMLRQALHISAREVKTYVKDKLDRTKNVRAASQLLLWKALLRNVQQQGRLEEMLATERKREECRELERKAKADAVSETLIEGMD